MRWEVTHTLWSSPGSRPTPTKAHTAGGFPGFPSVSTVPVTQSPIALSQKYGGPSGTGVLELEAGVRHSGRGIRELPINREGRTEEGDWTHHPVAASLSGGEKRTSPTFRAIGKIENEEAGVWLSIRMAATAVLSSAALRGWREKAFPSQNKKSEGMSVFVSGKNMPGSTCKTALTRLLGIH